MRSSRRIIAASLIVALATVAIAMTALGRHRPVVVPHAAPSPALTTVAVDPREVLWPITLEASGAIAPWQEASVGTQIGGYQLIDVRVNVGDEVKKGDLLARLDPALLKADEAQLKASDEQAIANRQRILALQKSGAVSAQDTLLYVTQAKTADALLASKHLQLRYTEVRAPDDGAISARSATLGAVVPVGQELFRLIRQNRLEWRGELTAAQLAGIRTGQSIALRLPDGSLAKATVRQTAPSLQSNSRLGIVYADISPGSSARAGMYVDGQVEQGRVRALTVPAQSIIIRDGRSYVVKLTDTSETPAVVLQAVSVGRRRNDEVEILTGVGLKDRLVGQGAGFLNSGDVVRLAPVAVARHTDATP